MAQVRDTSTYNRAVVGSNPTRSKTYEACGQVGKDTGQKSLLPPVPASAWRRSELLRQEPGIAGSNPARLPNQKRRQSMAKTNVPRKPVYTHEGGIAAHVNPEYRLRRSVMSCLLWEKEFYEDGIEIAKRISELVLLVKPEKAANIAIEARESMNLRHVPLWIVRAMAKFRIHKHLVASTLARIIQRPDEMTEFLSLYWLNRRQPLSAQVKKGLAAV
jgi:hypothetical protein